MQSPKTFSIIQNRVVFNVRIVFQGDLYGLSETMTHKVSEPIIEFYDGRFKDTKLGRFIANHYLKVLLNRNMDNGLCLHGGFPAWNASAETMRQVTAWLKKHEANAVDEVHEFEIKKFG